MFSSPVILGKVGPRNSLAILFPFKTRFHRKSLESSAALLGRWSSIEGAAATLKHSESLSQGLERRLSHSELCQTIRCLPEFDSQPTTIFNSSSRRSEASSDSMGFKRAHDAQTYMPLTHTHDKLGFFYKI